MKTMAPGDRVSWKAKAVQLSRSSNLSSLDYQNATRAQWVGDRGIIKIVLGFSANLHCCSGRLDGACDVDHHRNCEGVWSKRRRWSWL